MNHNEFIELFKNNIATKRVYSYCGLSVLIINTDVSKIFQRQILKTINKEKLWKNFLGFENPYINELRLIFDLKTNMED